jgi:antitoxin component of MazEF toxin-antitoxin module
LKKLTKDKPKYTLEELVKDINEGNRHEEIDFGGPMGKELL